MKKYQLSIILITFNLALSQEECLTPIPDINRLQQYLDYEYLNDLSRIEYFINVKTHIVRLTGGDGGISQADVDISYSDAISILDGVQSGIHLIIDDEIDYIDDTDFYYISNNDEAEELLDINDEDNRIDVYFVEGFGGCGRAEDIISTDIIIKNSCATNTSSLAHEIGHCFGLWHTHHGTYYEGGDDINQCPELVNGNNCYDCGDYLCDTPADPKLHSTFVNTDCLLIEYLGVDENGDEYDPDTNNLLSYSRKSCRDFISEDQLVVMKSIIPTLDLMENMIVLQNEDILFPGSNLGGTLDLINLENNEFNFTDIESGSAVPIVLGNYYSIRTNNYELQSLYHNIWNNNPNDIFLNKSNFEITEFELSDGLRARFKSKNDITINLEYPASIEIKDPWHIQHSDEVNPNNWVQTGEDWLIIENSNHSVFLNQNLDQIPGIAIYSLKAPRFYVSQNGIYVFDEWTSSNTNDAEFGVYPNHEVEPWWTNVVFRNEFTEITAEYIPVNEIENYNLIIAEDELLSIPAGSNLSFANGFTLTIEGSLLALGTADSPIQISGGNGIYTQNANVELSHVSFDNTNLIYLSSSTGVVDNSSFNTNLATVVDGGDFEFNHSTFIGSLAGLVAASMPTEPRISVDLNNCTFENSPIGLATTYRAITTIKNCEFINNETGIFSDSFSEPWLFQENENYGCEGNNNTIVDNDIGFGVNQDSQPWLGIYWDLVNFFEGHNRIDNTTDIQNASWHQRPIYAQVNNWNSGTNCYPSSPNNLSGGPIISSPTVYDVYYEGPITLEDFIVLRLEAGGEYSEASAIYQQIIENNPNSPYALWALAGLARCMEKNGQLHELIELFEYYVITFSGTQIEKYARSYGITSQIVKGDYDKAATMIASFESDYPGSEFEPKIRYENTILYKILQGSSNGRTMDNISEKIQAEYHLLSANHPETGLGILATILLGDEQTTSSSLAEVPDSYSLVQVYPNPFNPITNITYDIPEDSFVSIVVYDLAGRKVDDLVSGIVQSGRYNITWNADQFSSGVYFVTMTAPSFTSTQKIVLLK